MECWASLLCSAYRERRAEEDMSVLSVKAKGIKVLEWAKGANVLVQANMSWTGLRRGGMEAGEDLAQFLLQLCCQEAAPSALSADQSWSVVSMMSMDEAAAAELRQIAAETGRLIVAEALSGTLWQRLS
jgi:hypothetical protein